MAYVSVPKDLTRVKTKVMFNLAKRQLVCIGAAVLVGVPLFFLLKGSLSRTVAVFIMVLAMPISLRVTSPSKIGSFHHGSCHAPAFPACHV